MKRAVAAAMKAMKITPMVNFSMFNLVSILTFQTDSMGDDDDDDDDDDDN